MTAQSADCTAGGSDMDRSELHKLIDAYMDLHLDPKKKNALQKELASSPEAREIFWQKTYQHSLLHEIFIEASAKEPAEGARRSPLITRHIWRKAAAALLILSLSFFMFFMFGQSYPDFRISDGIRIAEDRELARGVILTAGKNGGELVLGGYCTVTFDPESTVRIEGSRYRERIYLERGGAVCSIQPHKGSFSVRTAVGEVAVQGTVFSVELVEERNGTISGLTGIHAHKGAKKMKYGKMIVNVIAGTVLVAGTWGDIRVAAGEVCTFTDAPAGGGVIADSSNTKKVLSGNKGEPRTGRIREPWYRPDAKGPGPHVGIPPQRPDPRQKKFREAYDLISRADKLAGQEAGELYSMALMKLEQNIQDMSYSSKTDYDYGWAVYCCIQLKEYNKALSCYSILKRYYGGTLTTEGVTRNWDSLMNRSKIILNSHNSPEAVKTLARMETLDKTTVYDLRAELLSLVKKANSRDEDAIQTLKQTRYHIGLVELLAENTIVLSPELQKKNRKAKQEFRCILEGTVTEKQKDHAVFKIARVLRTYGTDPGFRILTGISLRLEPDDTGNFSKLTAGKKVKLDLDHGKDKAFHVVGIHPAGQKVKKTSNQDKHPKETDRNKQKNDIF